jgi:glucosylceramidase
MRQKFLFYSAIILSLFIACDKEKDNPVSVSNVQVESWLTTGDRTQLLKKQTASISFTTDADNLNTIVVDSAEKFQTVDGFGFTLTGGSAYLINRMDPPAKTALLKELFGNDANDIGISYLRLSIGASDLSAEVFSYNDLPTGQTDLTLQNFSLSQDTVHLIPVLKEIVKMNPQIKLMATPWSAPVWMKDNGNSKGGSLQVQYYETYAQYFVKYIKAMAANGIIIDAITPQNEPQHGGNNPSMVMTSSQQGTFIKNHLGPAFKSAGITAKIIIWDHNCDNPNYPVTILNDPEAKPFIDGSAFHLYAGDISALAAVKNAHPDKNVYFTEQWTGANGSFDGDLKWHLKNVIIGSMRNWSKVALEWNLANDPSFGPHTPGGCAECKGGLTIDGSNPARNVGYYIVAHASKFIPSGSARTQSTGGSNLSHASFLRPDGKKVLIVLNETNTNASFSIKFQDKKAKITLPANAVGSYIW